MRIALLSAIGKDEGGARVHPAFASFAGAMIIEHQLELALRMGCEQVACLVDAVEREIVELQHRAEKAGAKFRALRHSSPLNDMISEGDELLVIAPGLLPDSVAAEKGLEDANILTLPAELAVPLGYERIDLEMAWSGILLAPGRMVTALSDLPEDVDVPSSLLRIALQSGGKTSMLDRDLLVDGNWMLDPDRQAIEAREKRWIEAQREDISYRAPGLAVAERAGARLARDVVGRGAQAVPVVSAVACAGASLLAAVLGYPAQGIVLTTLSALFAHMTQVVERVAALGRPSERGFRPEIWVDRAIDPLFVTHLVLAAPEEQGYLRVFVPLILFGLLRLAELFASENWRRTYGDRILLGLLLSPFAFAGYASELAALLALVVLGTRFFAPFRAD